MSFLPPAIEGGPCGATYELSRVVRFVGPMRRPAFRLGRLAFGGVVGAARRRRARAAALAFGAGRAVAAIFAACIGVERGGACHGSRVLSGAVVMHASRIVHAAVGRSRWPGPPFA
ncbi:hypothetical protein Bcen2424_6547 [Burkholderia cenocepacia HI2424]|nr:hypothetical protein Bcen2424_6547 [Burkholderia cenocepacia HI2424]